MSRMVCLAAFAACPWGADEMLVWIIGAVIVWAAIYLAWYLTERYKDTLIDLGGGSYDILF